MRVRASVLRLWPVSKSRTRAASLAGTSLVGAEPPRPEPSPVAIHDLDRRRQTCADPPQRSPAPRPACCSRLRSNPTWTARWAVLLRAGQSLLEPRLVTAPGGLQTGSVPHPRVGGQPKRERPAGHLNPSLARLRSCRKSLVAENVASHQREDCTSAGRSRSADSFDGHDGGGRGQGADAGDGIQDPVAAAAHCQDEWCDRWRDRAG
jgi:hypothetical protein